VENSRGSEIRERGRRCRRQDRARHRNAISRRVRRCAQAPSARDRCGGVAAAAPVALAG
jgi:hypothetical protein